MFTLNSFYRDKPFISIKASPAVHCPNPFSRGNHIIPTTSFWTFTWGKRGSTNSLVSLPRFNSCSVQDRKNAQAVLKIFNHQHEQRTPAHLALTLSLVNHEAGVLRGRANATSLVVGRHLKYLGQQLTCKWQFRYISTKWKLWWIPPWKSRVITWIS